MYNDIKNHEFKIELGGEIILTQQYRILSIFQLLFDFIYLKPIQNSLM